VLFGRGSTDHLRVEVVDTSHLAELIVAHIGGQFIRSLDLVCTMAQPPRGWWGTPGIRSIQRVSAELTKSGSRIQLAVERPVDPAILLAGAYRMIEPVRGPHGTFTQPLPRDATALAAGVRDVFADDVHAHLRRADTVFSADDAPDLDGEQRVIVHERGAWQVDGRHRDCWIDPAIHRPFGHGSAMPTNVVPAPETDWLDQKSVESLRDVTTVAGDVTACMRAQLHATGIVHESEVSIDAEPWQIAGVALTKRRIAYQQYSPDAVLDTWPTVTAVLVTHRTTHLRAIVDQISAFTYPRLQIVIGLHGLERSALPALEMSHAVSIVEIDAQVPFGAAMEFASRSADGDYLTKLDDDDVYAPNHIWDLVIAERYSGAELVGKALDWIYLADEDTTVFRPTYAAEKYGKFVAGGTLFISRANLQAVGGWRPVPKSIDLALIQAIRQHGGVVYRTQGLGYTYVRRGSGHTAQVDNQHFRTKITAEFPGRYQVAT
jgi:hypothetical protein